MKTELKGIYGDKLTIKTGKTNIIFHVVVDSAWSTFTIKKAELKKVLK
jgi:hypothetical protein